MTDPDRTPWRTILVVGLFLAVVVAIGIGIGIRVLMP